MAVHDIEVGLPPKMVLNRDVRFIVSSDGKKLGELLISRGSVDWVPARWRYRCRLTWERFDELMRLDGRET